MELIGGVDGYKLGVFVFFDEYMVENVMKDNKNILMIYFKNEIKIVYYISFKILFVGEEINKCYDNYVKLKDGLEIIVNIYGVFEIKNGGSGVMKKVK